jgi:hypothetical protein
MTEIKKTLALLEARWPEVMFIIVIVVLSLSISMSRQILISHQTGPLLHTLITLASFPFIIITFLLIIGFQRTVYLEDRKRQSPLVLLREGKHFFLPLAGLALIYTLALACLQILVLLAIKHAAPDFMDTRWGAFLVYRLPSTSVSLILMKPILLIFPLIIVLDCSVLKSFKMLGRCRLRDARELVILFLISLGLPFLWISLPSPSTQPISCYFLMAVYTIAGQFIDLMMAVMAIRFVAAQNLIYDNGSKPLDSQDSLNPSIV